MRPFARLPLRHSIRFLHAHAPPAHRRRVPERTTLVLGVSLAVAGYAGWRIAGSEQHIALDALPKQPPPKSSSSGREEVEADATFASAPERPIGSKPTRVDESVEKEGARHSKGDMGLGYPPDSTTDAVAQNGNTENRPGGGAEGEEEGAGAFDPVTGEINWDCPCLGGMAHGPCGQQFREAFSCFVYSEQEPKGIDCVEKFKNMQDCFREHPDVYGEEIADEEEDGDPSPASQNATKEASETADLAPATPSRSGRPVNNKDKAMSRETQ